MENNIKDIDVPALAEMGYSAYESFGFIEINDDVLKSNRNNLSEIHRIACESMICCSINGELTVVIDGRAFIIQSGMFCILRRGNTYQVTDYSKDLCIVCVLSQNNEYMAQLNNTLLLLDFKFRIDNSPCYKLQGTVFNELITLFHLMKDVMKRDIAMLKREIIRNYLCLIFCTIISETVQKICNAQHNEYGNEILKKFAILLGENCRQERKVSFYADRLCITPKYLSVLIKQASGRSTRQWIVDFVIAESKRLLQKEELTVLQVADALNFPNQSFFTKFFKEHTGKTPTEYKIEI